MSVWPELGLPLLPPLAPMEAETREKIPTGIGWQYEPKWDGFRCLVFREGEQVAIQSKAGQPLGRYFPELVAAIRDVHVRRFVLDGEIVIPSGEGFSFESLLQRIHPAQSRIRRLAEETPALVLAFDLLVDERGRSLELLPLSRRRVALERFGARFFLESGRLRLTPATEDAHLAERWLQEATGAGMDGVIAKRLDQPYLPGERSAMVKVKHLRTVDCVVGGFRPSSTGTGVGSLLLGLYGADGLLHHVGFCSAFARADRPRLLELLRPLVRPPGFTGRAPGGPSRWAQGRSTEWTPIEPILVCEVRYDHFSGGRFRHGTRFLRWRPDKAPQQCRMEQVERPPSPMAEQVALP